MKKEKFVPDVVQMAWQVIGMHQRIEAQEAELEKLKDIEKKYLELLDSSIAHGKKMMSGLLEVAMTPGVIEAIDKHNQEKCTYPSCECQNGRAECGKKLEKQNG